VFTLRSTKPLSFQSALVSLFLGILFTSAGCRSGVQPGAPSRKPDAQVVSAFYVGLAALQVGDDVRADSKLSQLTQLAPDEPAGWANWGLLALRQRNFEAAAERLERARSLAPDNDQIYYLIGLLESNRGRSTEAIAALRKAIELNPKNLIATYKLAEEIEQQGGENSEAEFQKLIERILQVEPSNLAARLELARIAAKRGDAEMLRQAVAKISENSTTWPDEVKEQLNLLQTAANGPDLKAATTRIAFLRNVLVRVPAYRQSLASIKPSPGEEAQPLTAFLSFQTPAFEPSPPDLGLTFVTEEKGVDIPSGWTWAGAFWPNGEGAPSVVVANGRDVRIDQVSYSFPGGSAAEPPTANGIATLDFNYDFKNDLVLAGAGGVRLLRQEEGAKFTDVTARTKLPSTVLTAKYIGAWPADIDLDGDLDIVLGAEEASPTVLRNNGDGSFAAINPFTGVSGLRDFVWADIDEDGDPDATLIDDYHQNNVENRLHVFTNERSGQFTERQLQAGLSSFYAITAADVNNDGKLDIVAVQPNGSIIRISDKDEGQDWVTSEIATFETHLYGHRDWQLKVVDLDNNGSNDLLLTFSESPSGKNVPGALVWLSDAQNKFTSLRNPNPGPGVTNDLTIGPAVVFGAADLNADGRLDLIGLSGALGPIKSINHGTKNYHWQVVRPRAAKAVGDQRINSFGIGGEIQIRSGLLAQKQLVAGPVVHFGLGEQSTTDVVRIVWPNGSVRAEFELKADQPVLAEQRLKGSCPFLFAYNGKQMEFVKDAVPWSSAIGLRINTLGTASVEATEEWYKISSDQLVPRDGYYDIRITAELWETYYYDHLSLMTVDHPVGTDIFVDERFVIPPAKLAITTVATPKKIARAIDDNGQDVTSIVSTLDGQYLDTFGRGNYQGVTRDHYVELDLGNDVPESGPLWLIAQGWMHPTDSSLNVAISQGQQEQAKPLSLEVPDGKGGWVVARPNLGFPAGRKKICLFDLTNVFRPGTSHRLRLRTNLEIYWDSLEFARGLQDVSPNITRLNAASADLHYRGYSVIEQPNDSSPEVPNYNQVAGSKQRWRDLIGYYTRFGDVRELLALIDNRYVIMNAGDEMTFRFAAPSAPPAGWVRDYVIVGDGWIKDGDYNSMFSKTVLPLPYHAKSQYTTAPSRLEDEWVYRQHPEDWQTYHTRYVTADVFQNGLRNEVRK
jgi:Flp pilus assembly protein TadD